MVIALFNYQINRV